nr:MAG TPA: hypothetical protein [Caudoviricetes sp.]
MDWSRPAVVSSAVCSARSVPCRKATGKPKKN